MEGLHGLFVGRVVDRHMGRGGSAGLLGQGDGGERLLIQGLEIPLHGLGPVDRDIHLAESVGPGEAQGDRDQHPRVPRLSDRGAVGELDHGVDPLLGVHHGRDVLDADVEEQVCLDHLQRLVHHGGGIGGHHSAHRVVRVLQRLGGGDPGERGGVPAAKGSPGGGDDQLGDLRGAAQGALPRARQRTESALMPSGAQRLGQGRMLRVHRDHLSRTLHGLGDKGPADHQRLLVREGQGGAGAQGGKCGPQPDGAGHAVEHDVGAGLPGDLHRRLDPGEDLDLVC